MREPERHILHRQGLLLGSRERRLRRYDDTAPRNLVHDRTGRSNIDEVSPTPRQRIPLGCLRFRDRFDKSAPLPWHTRCDNPGRRRIG